VIRIDPDGTKILVGSMRGEPNGFALERDGSFLLGNIGDGRFYRLNRDGSHEVVLDTWDGKPLGSANFAYQDDHGRMWLTVSTTVEPRSRSVHGDIPDGYILCRTGGQWRLAATGFRFTNEVRLWGDHLYLAETAKGRVVRLAVSASGALGPVETFGPDPLFVGAKIDGITFDAAGNLWVTEITRNAIIVLSPDGQAHTVFEDPQGVTLSKPASLTFFGPDLRRVAVGSLNMDRLPVFTAPYPGQVLPHWKRLQG
jgi:gluconolactonase